MDFNDTMFQNLKETPKVKVEEYIHIESPKIKKKPNKKWFLLWERKIMSSIKDCFSMNKSLIKKGTLSTAFCKPVFYSTKTFKSKSEEERYWKVAGEILNLRHLLVNDSENSYTYLMKFLRQYFAA